MESVLDIETFVCETAAVVMHIHDKMVIVAIKRYRQATRAGMAYGVGYHFLDDAETAQFEFAGKPPVQGIGTEVDVEGCGTGHPVQVPAQGGDETQVVERRGAQPARNFAHIGDQRIGHFRRLLQQFGQPLVGAMPPRRFDRDLERREGLPDFVVQFHRQSLAFLFLHRERGARKGFQLTPRQVERILGPLQVGNVLVDDDGHMQPAIGIVNGHCGIENGFPAAVEALDIDHFMIRDLARGNGPRHSPLGGFHALAGGRPPAFVLSVLFRLDPALPAPDFPTGRVVGDQLAARIGNPDADWQGIENLLHQGFIDDEEWWILFIRHARQLRTTSVADLPEIHGLR